MISNLKNGWDVAKEGRYRQKMLMVVKKSLLCAIDMLYSGHSLSEIRNHLGHDNIKSTMIYLHLDLNRRRQMQRQFTEYMQSLLPSDPKIEELFDWENKENIIDWLDSL